MKDDKWLYEISSKQSLINLNFKEIWNYRDLLFLFVKRNIVTVYKQTVIGPLWFFIQPLFTSVIFTLVFNNIAAIDTGIIPAFLFNLAGITAWNYFKVCLVSTSSTFRTNAGIFGKVYFPRFIVPLSNVISNLLKFGIQCVILIGFYIYYAVYMGKPIAPDGYVWLFPVYIILIAVLGLGIGMILSTFTTKYRDMSILISFGVQLLMYISAVPFPMAALKEKVPEYSWVIEYNPIAYLMEGFRRSVFGTDMLYFSWNSFFVIIAICIVTFLIGLAMFNRTEKTFIDTV